MSGSGETAVQRSVGIDPRTMTCCISRHPATWRRIEVETTYRYAWDAARVLVFMGAADEAYATWFGVPGQAVWSLNGVPMLPEGAPDG